MASIRSMSPKLAAVLWLTWTCCSSVATAYAEAPGELSSLAHMLVHEGREEPRVVACVACHRDSGGGDAGSAFGNITGHSAAYFAKQLRDYKSGRRENRVMQVIVEGLSETDIGALAAYYEHQVSAPTVQRVPEAPVVGVMLAQEGATARGIAACNACHGDADARSAAEAPNLYGQHPIYIINQLEAWQNGTRRNDPADVMAAISKSLTADEISAVAIYYARRERQ
ncbi:MAG: c-type cytochrome [Hyphomicrobiaceae bacterium]